jgi:hypothetical protein
MITTVTCSSDMRAALNENLHGLLTGKRKPDMVKEVNNTLGKMLFDVKMELMQKSLSGDRNPVHWFDKTIKPSTSKITNGRQKNLLK